MKKKFLTILAFFIITTLLCKAQNPVLWGMTNFGGSVGDGAVFKATASGTVTDVHSLGSGTDGQYPYGSLAQASNGLLYGMTENGGTISTYGMIFSYDISTGTYADIHDFGSGSDGYWTLGSLMQAGNGLLYGMTQSGGANGGGIIFSYNILTATYKDIHDFGSNGSPQGTLIQAASGLLYGMTLFGGTANSGVIFSYDITTSTYTELYDFKGGANDGQYPIYGSLLQVNDSLLYGMTSDGGINAGYHGGVIFRYNILTNKDTVLHDFGTGTDGNYPEGSLIMANNNLLYGMATYGGTTNYYGTIFSYNTSTGTYTSLHNFGNGNDGASPYGSLLQVNDSLLYGMTRNGGVNDDGTIFTYNILTDTETDIHDFTGADGQYPYGNLIEAGAVIVTPSTSTICKGGSVTLIASGAITYTWSPSTALSATTGDTVIASPTVTTTYTVTGTTGNGPYAATVVVTVGSNTTISVTSSPPICDGTSVTLSVSGALTYTWIPSTGLSATTGDSVTANPTATTIYSVTGTGSGGCTSTVADTVTIIAAPPIMIQPPAPLSVCPGQSITLFVPVSGSNYIWSPSSSLNSSTGDTVIASPTIQTTYTVTGTDSLGCSASGLAVVLISTPPAKPTISQNGDVLTSSATQGNQWVRNDTILSGATNQTYIVTIPGEYKVITENPANGCSSTSAAGYYTPTGINRLSVESGEVTVYPNPTSGEINVTISASAMDVKDWNLQVTDMLGRTLFTKSSLNYSNAIDLSNLSGGVYFICVITKTGRVVAPVVKQ